MLRTMRKERTRGSSTSLPSLAQSLDSGFTGWDLRKSRGQINAYVYSRTRRYFPRSTYCIDRWFNPEAFSNDALNYGQCER